jgi:hypothetical protein
LLDVRDLAPVCARNGIKLKFLGFKSGAEREEEDRLQLSLNAVRDLPGIHDRSQVIQDRLQNMADERSIAYDRADEYGPFDVVNFDLCESVAAPACAAEPRYFDAISRLVAIQRGQRNPWLLFLTTRADKRGVDSASLERLAAGICANSRNHTPFESRLGRFCEGIAASIFQNQSAALVTKWLYDKVSPLFFLKLFGLGIGKWLLALSLRAEPNCNMTMLPTFFYSVGGEPDMLSLAFLFEPGPRFAHDPSGLATFVPAPTPLNEGRLATDIIEQMARAENVDDILICSPEAAAQMIREAGSLLESAGYQRSAYSAWAKEYHPNVTADFAV